MGELTKQTSSGITQWLDRIDRTRTALIDAAATGNRVASAFAMADARVELIESLADEQIRAKLLRMTDPAIAMVELANNPSQEDRIRVCAIAILSGFTPGDDQFAIFGAGKDKNGHDKPGKLYVKEKGFRTLFAHFGIVPEVRTSHPEFVPLGTAGKKIWRVGGSASCTCGIHVYRYDFSGDEMLGIPGYETDNVAGIAAKARRRMLQALWTLVSPLFTSDQADDDIEVPTATASAIEHVAATGNRQNPFAGELELSLSHITDDTAKQLVRTIWGNIERATTPEQLEAQAAELTVLVKGKLVNSQARAPIARWYDHHRSRIASGGETP